jgi:hypothetical protein
MMYEIRYAYPSSEMAKQLNRSATGCYYVVIDGEVMDEPYDTLRSAREFAKSTGHEPSFYSADVFEGGY